MQQTHPGASATLLADSRNTLGEGATWCDATHALYWTDIEGARLWRCRADGSDLAQWPMPERLACFALTNEPHVLLVGLATHLAFFDLRSGAFTRIVDVEPDLPTRLNDGRCDPFGAFVFGMKDEGGEPPRAVGGFYRLNPDLTLERLALPAAAIANSIAFSPDGTRMTFCDSLVREILVCDYRADGEVDNVRPFARLTDADGDPDGSTMDRDGGLWNAQWGGRRVVRYGPDGVETERVAVPTAQPSCVALDGEGRLYVTSARVGLSDDALASDADAGGVFVVQTRHAGLATARFAGTRTG
ncbi:SMP-30/gluconolactonase/LRE family protein [Burkholderia anthina]|uniref:SMP-30/gluconolactonase/LRE family protein n=1 Tax=Burkholderia anthina TaxID=179879 RepID=UPI001CF24BFA|nr:SMP-30/gluconolactonase/LRE family protein [Burkholderia anthina]MCA8091080.1 SMP-30/gluconolactonase/LRE family protein [Burkholderia anthina]